MPKLVQTDTLADFIAPVTRLEWRERTLVFRQRGGRVNAVHGWQYGTLVVHRSLAGFNVPNFTITHRPSLVAVAKLADSDEAVVQTEWLWESCPRAWCEDEVNKTLISKEVLQWLKEHQ